MIDDIITIIVIIIILSIVIYQMSTVTSPTKSASIFGSGFFQTDDIEYVVVKDANNNLSRIHAEEFLAPTGTIVLWPGATAPDGWGFCDGDDIPAGSELGKKLGQTKKPNLGGVTIQGAVSNDTVSNLNTKDGANSVQLNHTHVPPHNHSLSWGGTHYNKFQPLPWLSYVYTKSKDNHRKCQEVNKDGDSRVSYAIGDDGSDWKWDLIQQINLETGTHNSGGTTTVDVRQPSIILNYIIKY